MPFVRVQPDDLAQVTAVANIEEAARQVDDPDAFPTIPEILAGQMRYGWDLEPADHYFYIPEDASDPVGVLVLDMPPATTCIWFGPRSSYIRIIAAVAMAR
jgi:hypothetical protein